jgi:hypothetical protein
MGMIGLIINTAVLLAIASYFVVAMVTIGGYIYTRMARQTLTHWYDVLMSFGLGMVAFCLVNVVLIQIHAFYPIVAWIQFVTMGYIIYICSDIRIQCLVCLDTALAPFFVAKSSSESLVYWILAGLSIVYIYYAFNLGFIPYSTAWDANHAYMYYPKVWALNNGLFWSNGPGVSPSLWMVYISYWFSLRQPMPKWFLAPDTIAVFMNMLAGPFALLTGIGLVRQVISFMFDKLSATRLATAMTIGR